jgi:acyl-CoA thioesterase I
MNLTLIIAAHFMNGQAVFTGMALVLISMLMLFRAKKQRVRSALNVLMVLGAIFVLASATPWPYWWYGVWLLVFAGSMLKYPMCRVICSVLLLLLSIGMMTYELPYHISPRISTAGISRIYVIGDSLASGAEPFGKNWPEIIGEESGIPVTRLSFGGATTKTILHSAKKIQDESSIVLLEIGGNDLLAGNPTFYEDLDRLMGLVAAPNKHLVMVELPLPPSFNRYGMVQRALAKKYDATLIPKKHLAAVLSAKDATEDGLHLSISGHKYLAEHILGLLDLSVRKTEESTS